MYRRWDAVGMTRKPRHEPFSAIVARAAAEPRRAKGVRGGRTRDGRYCDQSGTLFELVAEAITPEDAQRLVTAGAGVVYDACGCGGDECELDWIDAAGLDNLRTSPAPLLGLRSRKVGLAKINLYRDGRGRELLEVLVDVTWGDRIPG
jgi:hypothetical protein